MDWNTVVESNPRGFDGALDSRFILQVGSLRLGQDSRERKPNDIVSALGTLF